MLCPPPPPISSIAFTTPSRLLVTPHDLALFQSSATHELLLSFVTDLNNSVLNLPNSAPTIESAVVTNLLRILDHVANTIAEFPPEDDAGSRFGNKSFQGFYDAVWERAAGWHALAGVELPPGAVEEMARYFCESFGNRTRIDYGSGHELNFIAWLHVSHSTCLALGMTLTQL